MAHVITVGNQKGGVGKTTTCGMLSYMLNKTHRVLSIDFDMQGNLSQMLNRSSDTDYIERPGIMDALKNGIIKNHNLFSVPIKSKKKWDIITANDDLAMFNASKVGEYLQLKQILKPIHDQYDFIVIDTPPSLGSHLITALMASDSAILMAMTHPFAVDAAVRFTNNLKQISAYNQSLKMLGVAITLFEKTSFNRQVEDQIRQAYGHLVFDTTLHKRAAIMKMSMFGIQYRKKADKLALEQYKQLAEEVINRVGHH